MKRADKMKIVAIVQARMGSSRLPGKVIKPIINKPMILHVLDRLSNARYVDQVILATSNLESEGPLIELVSEKGYEVFTGDENNVLKRYVDANRLYNGDIIIRITGDCPLIDPVIVDNVVTHYLMYDYDYVRLDVPNTFIRGFDVEVFSKETLERAYKDVEATDNKDYREHVTLYMYENKDRFKVGYVQGEGIYRKDYRVCVDTEEDFEVVSEVYEYYEDEFVVGKKVVTKLNNID
ncbi:MAG: glycosyltransferase family protein [Tissierellaceae bacterium]